MIFYKNLRFSKKILRFSRKNLGLSKKIQGFSRKILRICLPLRLGDNTTVDTHCKLGGTGTVPELCRWRPGGAAGPLDSDLAYGFMYRAGHWKANRAKKFIGGGTRSEDLSTVVRRIKNHRLKRLSAKNNENKKRYNGGFPAEFLVFGPYRKLRQASRSISSNFHRNRTAGELVNTQKRHFPIICLFSFTQ